MSDGTIKIDLEVDSKNAKSQAKSTGDAIGKQVASGAQSSTKDTGSKVGDSISKGIKSSTKGTGDAVGSQIGGGLKSSLGSAASEAASGIGAGLKDAASGAIPALDGINVAGLGIGAGIAAGAAAGVAAIAGLTSQAVEAYSSFQQLTGGVETLFKDSAPTVEAYADQAFMSANDYMSTVTSFSASLIQGLGGDTAQAAEIGNMAVIDMSDNANKLGTDIGSIQMTYQSLARGNYAMLDNLKLGRQRTIAQYKPSGTGKLCA